ncbi:hypothetical protein [Kitasatospora sp. A2-31]|uniref:hypothetical protein n=1 Tax=Kitasatospora sp. A2-31 TaxID=2916414 RepID=UPI001EE93F53|nr:hypothetical protein [Kitasatospora sp. A2-31]MCG6493435.1 hypothetical protein [Kitasatospora sp. A2-31]
MPKISQHGGATNDAEPVRMGWIGEPGPELLNLPGGPAAVITPEEETSPGNSSETSSPKPPQSETPSAPKGRSRARTTASRSATDQTDSSTARGTDGDPTAPTSDKASS